MVTAVPCVDEEQLHDVFDCKPQTLLALAERVEQSKEDMQLVYREAEMDELWRAVTIAVMQLEHDSAPAEKVVAWNAVKDEVMRIHDLVGVDLDTDVAAFALRRLADTVIAL